MEFQLLGSTLHRQLLGGLLLTFAIATPARAEHWVDLATEQLGGRQSRTVRAALGVTLSGAGQAGASRVAGRESKSLASRAVNAVTS